MNDSYLRKVITLASGIKWYICDETIYNGNIYYLALKLDEKNEPSDESKIFKRIEKNDKVYFSDKINEEEFKHLTTIFITDFNSQANEIINEEV